MTASEYVYVPRERLRVVMEGFVPPAKPGEDPTPGELTITLNTPDGPYDVTVPLGYVTVERLIPADGIRNDWRHFNVEYGPLVRVHPPASAGQEETTPEKPNEPRLMVGDVWSDDCNDEWTVTRQDGRLLLTWDGETRTWDGPLTLVERAGCRRTTKTVTAGQLRPGMVVSYPDWSDEAPVRLLTVQALAADAVEVTYEPLGDDEVGTGTAAPDARITLWDEIAGGTR